MLIVTGSSNNHYKSLLNLINSFLLYYKNDNNNFILIYNLGIDEDKWKEMQDNFKKDINIIFDIFDYSIYPSYLNININAGEYAWKPVIIYNTCEKYGGNILWMDAGNIIHKKLDTLNELITNDYIHTGLTSGDIKLWTYQLTLDYMKPEEDILYKQNRNAACVGFNYNILWVKDFVKEWKNLSLIKECIAPEGSGRHNHRQDQALLSILYYKYQKIYNFKSFNQTHSKFFEGYSIHNDVD